MIVVDQVQSGATPWANGRFSHLLSDKSVEELLDFAKKIGLPLNWYQHRHASTIPHFDVAPSWRARAVAAGAVEVDKRGFVEALRLYRSRNVGPWTSRSTL